MSSQAFLLIRLTDTWLTSHTRLRRLVNGTKCIYCNRELLGHKCYRKISVHQTGALKFACLSCYRKYVSDE